MSGGVISGVAPCLLLLRSRAWLPTLGVLVAGAAAAWVAYRAPAVSSDAAVTLLAPAWAASAIGLSLHSHGPEVDRSASRRWWPTRTAHLLALACVASLLLVAAGTAAGSGEAAGAVRNVLGVTGVAALAAVVMTPRLSWLPSLGYACLPLLAEGPGRGGAHLAWTWLGRPGANAASWCAALGLLALGAGVYARCGPRERP